MRNTSSSAFATVVAVAGMFAIGGTLSAPAVVLAQTGQKANGTAGKTTSPTYTACTPSASNNNCKGSKSVGMADPDPAAKPVAKQPIHPPHKSNIP